MKLRKAVKLEAASGLCVGPGHQVAARVARDGEGLRVIELADVATPVSPPGEAGAGTMAEAITGSSSAVGVVPEDLLGVMHVMSLPASDDATMRKLIAAQLEARIPGQAAHVRWSWQRESRRPDASALVCTVARKRFDELQSTLDATGPVRLVIPPAAALHTLLSRCASPQTLESLAVVATDRRVLHVLMYEGGRLAEALSQGISKDSTPEAIGEQLTRLMQGRDNPHAITFLAAHQTQEAASLAQVIRPPVVEPASLLRLPGLTRYDLSAMLAVGAAIAATEPHAHLNLAEDGASAARPAAHRITPKMWVGAAACLFLSLALHYWSDLRAGRQSAEAAQSAGLSSERLASLDLELAVARYLETSGPSLLAVLDELAQKTEGFMVEEMRYDRGGQWVFRAVSRSPEEISGITSRIASMQTLRGVQVRNRTALDRDRFEYTIVAAPSDRFFQPFVIPMTGQQSASAQAQSGQGGGS